MKDQNIVIYDYPHNSYLELIVKDDSFKFVSEVRLYEDEYSEVHYSLDNKEVSKLLSLMSFDEFVEFAKKIHLKGLLDFFKEKSIDYIITPIY